jgi:hypothetical protein
MGVAANLRYSLDHAVGTTECAHHPHEPSRTAACTNPLRYRNHTDTSRCGLDGSPPSTPTPASGTVPERRVTGSSWWRLSARGRCRHSPRRWPGGCRRAAAAPVASARENGPAATPAPPGRVNPAWERWSGSPQGCHLSDSFACPRCPFGSSPWRRLSLPSAGPSSPRGPLAYLPGYWVWRRAAGEPRYRATPAGVVE